MNPKYNNNEDVIRIIKKIMNLSLREIIPAREIALLEPKLNQYGANRKGQFGELFEEYAFGQKPNSAPEPDLQPVGIELKTTPLKKLKSKKYSAKERLVFSMIDYKKIVNETWETSSFLKKNKKLLILFYLYAKETSILDYKFEFYKFLNFLEDLTKKDLVQIKNDWENIVKKIKDGEAHLLSEGDTFYLGACTKAANNKVLRDQPGTKIPAKPRALCFKQSYLNILVKRFLEGIIASMEKIQDDESTMTIEEVIHEKLNPFIGMDNTTIEKRLNVKLNKQAKQYKRNLANRMLGVTSKRIEELEKANITVRALTLEHTGTLKESISFSAFDYRELILQTWYDEKAGLMADLHEQLETKKFLFVVFRKVKNSKQVVFEKYLFWNFPSSDMALAKAQWDNAVKCIKSGKYSKLPKLSDNMAIHVRPHGRNKKDVQKTPQNTYEVKKSFWLNAKYIQQQISKK